MKARYNVYFINEYHIKRYLPSKLVETNDLEKANKIAQEFISKEKHLRYLWIQDSKEGRFVYLIFNSHPCVSGRIWERI